MTIKPLKREHYERAQKLGIKKIMFNFSGGSDEGFLDVNYEPNIENIKSKDWMKVRILLDELSDWAWSVWHYSGAGCGSDFGDDIEYDLENKSASHIGWQMEIVSKDVVLEEPIEIES